MFQDLHQFKIELPAELVDALFGIDCAHLFDLGYLLSHRVLLFGAAFLATHVLRAAVHIRVPLP